MSSNMIKAYSIAYDKEKIQVLDMGAREEVLEERIRELMPLRRFDAEEESTEGFVPGLQAEMIEEIPDGAASEPEQPAPAMTEEDIEALKNTLREEIMNEMQPILQRKGDDIVANAHAQAEGLLDAAKRDAEIAKEGIFQAASAQGYEEGVRRAKIEEERTLADLEQKRIALEQEYAAKIADLEPAFTNVLIELVKKVTGVAYDSHKEVLLYLLRTGLEFSHKDTEFTVVLSENDYEKYTSLMPKITEHYKEKFALDFKKDAALADGSCKLENENRVIECGVGIRLKGLLEELELLS